ncbi:MAG: transcriptional regulator [Roseovarius pacificus]|nr:transcriptional regulator [Roseovarius pacificus]
MNVEVTNCNPHRRIPAVTVQQMCGDISAMTLHRWLNKPELNFPRPIYIGRRRYWREADVIEWLDLQNSEAA